MGKSSVVRFLGPAVILGAWATLCLFLFAMFLEYGNGIRLYQRFRYGDPSADEQRSRALNAQYQPFAIQHINPFTIFSLPLSIQDRLALSNETVTLTANGFRGVGPDMGGNRELAFFIGGSTAFGAYATSDTTTIPGFLLALQDRYHVVNAGVPSFNSTQELHRLVDTLLEREPKLIIALDGANDVSIALGYVRQGKEYPLGTPESFNVLEEYIDDIRHIRPQKSPPILTRLFPELSRHSGNLWKRVWQKTPADTRRSLSQEEMENLAQRLAKKYLLNVRTMAKVSESLGARFLAILQPVRDQHACGSLTDKDKEKTALYSRFRALVLKGKGGLPLVDFTTLFDDRTDASLVCAPCRNAPGDRCIFVDRLHFSDAGNEIVAKEIVNHLQKMRWLP